MKYDSFGALMEAYNINALDGVNKPGKRERSDLDENEHRSFVTDCFDTYEGFGFINTFHSPFEENEKYNGRKFTVIRRLTEKDADLECLPMWRIRFEKGKEIDAYPEEICFVENLSLTVISEICSHGCNGICYKEACPRGDWTKNAFGIKPSPKYGNDKNCPLLQFSAGQLPKNMPYKERTHVLNQIKDRCLAHQACVKKDFKGYGCQSIRGCPSFGSEGSSCQDTWQR